MGELGFLHVDADEDRGERNEDEGDPVTCIDTFYGTGTSTISNGTGSFAGIAGNGTYTYHGTFIATRTPQGCSQQGTVIDVVHDHGTVILG